MARRRGSHSPAGRSASAAGPLSSSEAPQPRPHAIGLSRRLPSARRAVSGRPAGATASIQPAAAGPSSGHSVAAYVRRTAPVLSGPLRSPAARCARRPHSASCASLPRYGLRRPSSASSAPHDAHRIRRPAVPAGRPIRIPSFPRPPGFNRRAQPPRPLRPGFAFRPIRPLPYARFPSGIRPASLFRSGSGSGSGFRPYSSSMPSSLIFR